MEQVKKPALPKHAPIRKKKNLLKRSSLPKYRIPYYDPPEFEDLDFENMTDEEIEAAMEDYR